MESREKSLSHSKPSGVEKSTGSKIGKLVAKTFSLVMTAAVLSHPNMAEAGKTYYRPKIIESNFSKTAMECYYRYVLGEEPKNELPEGVSECEAAKAVKKAIVWESDIRKRIAMSEPFESDGEDGYEEFSEFASDCKYAGRTRYRF